jgi:S1-C subfamily serine protease
LEVVRKDQTLRISVSPGEYPEIPPPVVTRTQPRDVRIADLGLEVQWLTADEAKKFNVKLTDGVIVTQVTHDGLAHQRGIKPGDIITSANGERTFSPAQLREALRGADLKKGVRLELTSGETGRTETLKAGE